MTEPILTVRNLVAGYGSKEILHSVDLDVNPGEIRVILGTSGCGKTTLMRNILQLFQPWEGQVLFEDIDLMALSEVDYDAAMLSIGITFQSSALLKSITVGENVAIPLTQHTDLSPEDRFALVKKTLELVHLDDTENLMPSELSGGMMKRAALARAIILDPKLIICDEPTAGLDPVTMKSIDALFLELREKLNTAFLVVSHEVNSIKRIADKIIFLEEGRVLLSGSLEEALNSQIPEINAFFN